MDRSNMSYLVEYLLELQKIYSIPASDWAELAKSAKAAEAMKELMWQNGQILLQLYTVLFGSGGEGELGTVTEVPATGAEQKSVLVVEDEHNDMDALFQYPIDETTSFGCDSYVDLFDCAPTVTPPTSPPFTAFFETQSPLPEQPGEQDSAQFLSLTSLRGSTRCRRRQWLRL